MLLSEDTDTHTTGRLHNTATKPTGDNAVSKSIVICRRNVRTPMRALRAFSADDIDL